MAGAWLVLGLAILARETVAQRPVHDAFILLGWTGGFAFLGWVTCVLPVLTWLGHSAWFCSRSLGWVGWTLLGLASYSLLVVPLFGREAWQLLWYPAVMGAIAGTIYSHLP